MCLLANSWRRADFDTAKKVPKNQLPTAVIGTCGYMAPEGTLVTLECDCLIPRANVAVVVLVSSAGCR